MGRTHIDFETRSLADLLKVGGDVYAQHSSTRPLMLAYDTGDILAGTHLTDFFDTPGYPDYAIPTCPTPILDAMARNDIFVAHNARFEQAIWHHICHRKWGWPMPRRWSCTAARARYWGLRASLDGAASDLEVINQKNAAGKEFIDEFCKPRKYQGAKKNGIVKLMWSEPHENPEGWARGKQYCIDDVKAEKDIDDILPDLPEFEQELWDLDFRMNTRGIPIDMPMVERAQKYADYFTDAAFKRFDEVTNLRPTQRDRVLEYLNQRDEIESLGDLRSKTLKRIVLTDLPADLQDVISIRIEAAKASVKKFDAMRRGTDADGRARGLFLYGGAHTMRWSGKRIQPHNFTRGLPEIQAAMFGYLEGPWWGETAGLGHNGGPALELPEQPAWVVEAGFRFPRPLGALAQSMRGFIAAPKGTRIVAGDYAQIEARVLAWLARCLWLLEAFKQKKDPYVTFAGEHMYKRPYEEYFEIKNGKTVVKRVYRRERQIAKSAVLGCGFGLGKDKFVEYCDNSDLIITIEESERTIRAYRGAHPEIADYERGLWARVEAAAVLATANEGHRVSLAGTGVSYCVHRLDSERFWLLCTLPSGRHIAYYRPKIHIGQRFGRAKEILSFRTEWASRSYRENTYGGKLVENMVQAIARDIMGIGALNVDKAGYPVIGLVHDEILSLPEEGFGSHQELCALMCRQPEWITDLPIEAEGGEMVRYGK